jgi:threonine synthase
MLTCAACGLGHPVSEPRWRCDCGGYLRLEGTGLFRPEALAGRPRTIWRYHEALGIVDPENRGSLEEGSTPLATIELAEREVLLKLDFLLPTGSFKDRGSAVMLSKLREWGVRRIVEDSSGNAGASVAAYAARAGIEAEVFVPASASAGKLAQIGLYGARLERVAGTREDTTAAALRRAEATFYASHNWSPYFVAGCKTAAYEIAEQLAWRAPDWVVVPVGGGALLLGLAEGFRELHEARIIDRMPRLAAVQAEACAPIQRAWAANEDTGRPVEKRPTAAEGISIASPVKGRDVLDAIRASGGVARTVGEDEIWDAFRELASRGIYAEPTSAAAAAALPGLCASGLIRSRERAVVVITGSGLKATDKILEHSSRAEHM